MNTVATPSEVTKGKHQIDLIDGSFTASEAQDLVVPMLTKKINFHQIKRMSLFEKNHKDTCAPDRDRILELEEAKATVEDIFLQAKIEGKKVKMHSTIHITLED
ncbi:hypothetical protein ACFO3O_13950 [Dokdonia ponticola]|uniref:Uncharacterized protein n=1 Tax=Dokdonia ponticola TaxID=2041041 RepID=A0ABV9HZU4_9FLAO